jgi:hypothetical protein
MNGSRLKRLTLLLASIAATVPPALGWASDAIFVVADTSDAAPLAIPSVAAEFGSLADVSEAVEADLLRHGIHVLVWCVECDGRAAK